MFNEDIAEMPSCEGMTEVAQRRAAAAFNSWLWEGLLASGIENVQEMAHELDVAPEVAVNIWSDRQTAAVLGARLAHCLHSYLEDFGWYFVATAGHLGDKATLAEPSLDALIDDVVAEWNAVPNHGCLESLRGAGFRQLLVLVIKGAFARVSMGVVCDCVPDDAPTKSVSTDRGH